jgi:hypothetical protein
MQYFKELFLVTPVRFERTLCVRNSPAVNTLPYFGLSHFGVPIAIGINFVCLNAQSKQLNPATPWNQFYHSTSFYAKERLYKAIFIIICFDNTNF